MPGDGGLDWLGVDGVVVEAMRYVGSSSDPGGRSAAFNFLRGFGGRGRARRGVDGGCLAMRRRSSSSSSSAPQRRLSAIVPAVRSDACADAETVVRAWVGGVMCIRGVRASGRLPVRGEVMGAEEIGLEIVGRWWWWVSLILVLSRQWGGWFCAYGMGGFGGMYLSCGQHVRWRHSITWQSAYLLLLVSPKIEISI